MHRFLIQDITGAHAVLPPDEARHARSVLRLKPGDAISVSDGAGHTWHARIHHTDPTQTTVELLNETDPRESPCSITLYQGLPKAEKLELITQKAVELGITRLVPVVMTRSIPHPTNQAATRKTDRLTRIALEAVKQCGRALIPSISPPIPLDDALRDMRTHECLIMPWEQAQTTRMTDVQSAHPGARDVALVIGPEGGIDPAEAASIIGSGGHAITLGPRILRCETAAIAAVAMAMQLWGDL